MKKRFPLILLFFLFLFSCKKEGNKTEKTARELPNFGNINLNKVFTPQDSELENKDSIVAKIDQYYQTIWEAGNLWGGFLVAKGDQIIYEKYRGYAQPNHIEPITAEVPLHVASISKTLTAMAMMKLVEAGFLNLDDKVTQFFPNFPYPNVTVKNLLTQRSGLPKYEYFIEKINPNAPELAKKFLSNEDILNLMILYKPEVARDPDTGFMYANTNFALLALIIEKVTKTKFPQAMKQIVFDPLKMKNTFIYEEKDTLRAAKSFYNRGERPHPLDRLDLIYGDKNVYTTPRDLLNFSIAMYSPDFLKPELMDMVFTPFSNEKQGVNNYGIGFRMKVFSEDEKLTYHTGWWHGTNSVFAHLLKSKVTIIAIGNKFSKGPYSALALSSLFENFPYETEKLVKVMGEQDRTKTETDSVNVDSE